MADINVKQEEMRTTREVVRELGGILAELERGNKTKIVIMGAGSHMKGVIVSVDEYARLTSQ